MLFDRSTSNIFQHVSLLTNLMHLDILGFDTMSDASLLHVDFERHKLQALQTLRIDSKRVHLGENIFGLLQLPSLRQVWLADSILHEPCDTCPERFAALIYKFARLRPEVKLQL